MDYKKLLRSKKFKIAVWGTGYIGLSTMVYFSKQKTGFEVNPDGRTEGTYTKYSSLDDKLDGLHYYTWFIHLLI